MRSIRAERPRTDARHTAAYRRARSDYAMHARRMIVARSQHPGRTNRALSQSRSCDRRARLLPLQSRTAQTADPNLARNIAASCANCHGTNGVSKGGVPSLAGQAKADLVRKMQDFKAGTHPSTIMPQLAKGYTDEQIDLVAGFFAAQKP